MQAADFVVTVRQKDRQIHRMNENCNPSVHVCRALIIKINCAGRTGSFKSLVSMDCVNLKLGSSLYARVLSTRRGFQTNVSLSASMPTSFSLDLQWRVVAPFIK